MISRKKKCLDIAMKYIFLEYDLMDLKTIFLSNKKLMCYFLKKQILFRTPSQYFINSSFLKKSKDSFYNKRYFYNMMCHFIRHNKKTMDYLYFIYVSYQSKANELCEKFLVGKINFLEFKDKLLCDSNILYSLLFSSLKSSECTYFDYINYYCLLNTKDCFDTRIYYYQEIEMYLKRMGIEKNPINKEYAEYKKISKLCPDWFQNDKKIFERMFDNYDEIIKNNSLEKELEKKCICKCDYFPDWIQYPEWPIEGGMPLMFLGQSDRDEDIIEEDIDTVEYYFQNHNGKKVIIKQNF